MHGTKRSSLSDPAASFPFLFFCLAFSPRLTVHEAEMLTAHLMFIRSTVEINYASGWAILGVRKEKEQDWIKQKDRTGQRKKKGGRREEEAQRTYQHVIFRGGKKSVFLLWLKCIFGTDQAWCLKRFILHHLLKIALNYFFFVCPHLSDMRSETRGTSVSSPTLLRLPRSQVIRGGEDKKEPHLMNTKSILLFNTSRTHSENSISLPNTIRETDSGCADVALYLWARCIPGDRACKECIIKS